MSYFHKRYGGRRALSGVQSQPMGGRVAKSSLGDISEYLLVPPPPPPPPPPSRVMASRGRVGPRWYRQLQGTTLGADETPSTSLSQGTLAVPTLSEPAGNVDVINRIDTNVASLVAAEAEDAKRRKFALIFTGIGLLFGAAKLGIIAIPHIRRMRTTE